MNSEGPSFRQRAEDIRTSLQVLEALDGRAKTLDAAEAVARLWIRTGQIDTATNPVKKFLMGPLAPIMRKVEAANPKMGLDVESALEARRASPAQVKEWRLEREGAAAHIEKLRLVPELQPILGRPGDESFDVTTAPVAVAELLNRNLAFEDVLNFAVAPLDFTNLNQVFPDMVERGGQARDALRGERIGLGRKVTDVIIDFAHAFDPTDQTVLSVMASADPSTLSPELLERIGSQTTLAERASDVLRRGGMHWDDGAFGRDVGGPGGWVQDSPETPGPPEPPKFHPGLDAVGF